MVAKSTVPPFASMVAAASRAIFVFKLPVLAEPDSTKKLTSRWSFVVALIVSTSLLGRRPSSAGESCRGTPLLVARRKTGQREPRRQWRTQEHRAPASDRLRP